MIEEDDIYSNDIYAFLCTYGVEAARQAILREVGSVFKVYSIDVDIRHLELIADYMVRYAVDDQRSCAYSVLDIRWRLQAIQPQGHCDQLVSIAQGILRNQRVVHI